MIPRRGTPDLGRDHAHGSDLERDGRSKPILGRMAHVRIGSTSDLRGASYPASLVAMPIGWSLKAAALIAANAMRGAGI
ncbi:hypothetical protein GCM10010994_07470 [Chelatococcus reniformis]|uniref:Uncharacterized protein n=1 Tax=Chelatococcus reniformis TaxID=1494448 RepID=A0A916TY55_9HYPH|nr:hypothetical protein GCM10010994_07470 [Chelatococcus reniformis]